jgi:hypothetical protein
MSTSSPFSSSLPTIPRHVRQHPTFTGLRISSIEDAHCVLYAVYSGLCPLMSRRLDASEQLFIHSGDVYVWETRKPVRGVRCGIERFRDGRKWGPVHRKGVSFFFFFFLLLGCLVYILKQLSLALV